MASNFKCSSNCQCPIFETKWINTKGNKKREIVVLNPEFYTCTMRIETAIIHLERNEKTIESYYSNKVEMTSKIQIEKITQFAKRVHFGVKDTKKLLRHFDAKR